MGVGTLPERLARTAMSKTLTALPDMAIARNALQRLALTAVLAVAIVGIAQAAEPRAQSLMREHKCYICHADQKPLAGPAFADVAAAYEGNQDAVAIVATLIRSGKHGGGPWHMPPHPEISAAEATAIARYVLSLEPRPLAPQGPAPIGQPQPATAISPRS